MAERGGLQPAVILPFGLARDDSFVRGRLVCIAGQNAIDGRFADFDVQPRPPLVGLAMNLKLQAEVTLLDIAPRAKDIGAMSTEA
jgi:hypothetical protein